MIPITFIVIVATALIYGLSGGPVARALGVARTGPGGVLLVGATDVGRAIGRALQDRGLTVVLWTGDDEQARAAEADGLTVYQSDPTDNVAAALPSDLDGLDYALAVSDNSALNAMVATDLAEYFASDHVFQLPVSDERHAAYKNRARALFDESATYQELLARIKAGAEIIDAEPRAAANGGTDIRARLGPDAIPMFLHTPGKDLSVLAAGERPPLAARRRAKTHRPRKATLTALRGCAGARPRPVHRGKTSGSTLADCAKGGAIRVQSGV